jgi:translocation and assembly module TamB
VDGEANLLAPDLTIHEGSGEGIHVQALRLTATAAKGRVDYDATADSLGAKIRFRGSAPIVHDLSRAIAQAEVQAAGFRLNEAWRGLGIGGGLAELDGLGAIDANLRASIKPHRLWANSIFEFRDLHYGPHLHLGGLRGTAALTPTTWRLDGVTGDLFGGLATGEARGEATPAGPRRVNFDFKIDRASLPRMLGGIPSLARGAEGFGSLRAAGLLDETLHASAEILVPRARVHGLPVAELRFPAEIEVSPTTGAGSIHARHWTAHLAGGSIRGSTWLRLGEDRSFNSDVQLTGLDLEILSRLQDTGKHPATGRLSGDISLNGPNPNDLAKVRGRVDLDLDEASLVEMPVFRELDRFLGASRGGGLFEDGDIHGTIANRTLFVEALTLEGRIVQLHATGSITFDGGLDLEVLVNTKDVIPQSGMAIISLIPGLGQALGRGEEVLMRVVSFLERRLLKFRIGGTLSNPTVRIDAGVAVTQGAAGFFSSALKIPIGGRR